MRRRSTVFVAVAASLVLAGTAAAQTRGAVGIVMGYPASVGVLWQATDRLAVRPDVTLAVGSSESTVTGDFSFRSADEGWSAGLGLSLLVTMHRSDAFRVYASPQYAYGWGSRTLTEIGGLPGAEVTDTRSHWVSGMMGGHYGLGTRVGLFGEAGWQYVRSTSTSVDAPPRNSTNVFTSRRGGLTSSVGIVLYF